MRPALIFGFLVALAAALLGQPFQYDVEALLPSPFYLFLALLALAWVVSAPIRRSRRSRWPALALGLAVWACIGMTPGATRLLLQPLEHHRPKVSLDSVSPGGDIILLTSGSVERAGGQAVVRLDRAAWERTHAAAALWKRTQGRLIVVGGPVMDGLSPARAMADAAQALGVPADRLVVDDKATSTRDSFDRLPPPTAGQPQPWLVTSATHMQRALLSAEGKGLSVRAFPCDYLMTDSPGWRQWLPSTYAYPHTVAALHEWVGLAYYRWLQIR